MAGNLSDPGILGLNGSLIPGIPLNSSTGDDGSESAPPPANYDQLVQTHGSLMFLAWAVLVPAAVIVAKFGKGYLSIWWFRIHVSLLVLAAVCNVVSFGCIYFASNPDHFDVASNGYHPVIGLTIFVALFAQILLGFVIDWLYKPSRKSIPFQDVLHWWLGRSTIVLAFVNIPLGLTLYGIVPDKYYYLYYAWLAIVAAVFMGLLDLKTMKDVAAHNTIEAYQQVRLDDSERVNSGDLSPEQSTGSLSRPVEGASWETLAKNSYKNVSGKGITKSTF